MLCHFFILQLTLSILATTTITPCTDNSVALHADGADSHGYDDDYGTGTRLLVTVWLLECAAKAIAMVFVVFSMLASVLSPSPLETHAVDNFLLRSRFLFDL